VPVVMLGPTGLVVVVVVVGDTTGLVGVVVVVGGTTGLVGVVAGGVGLEVPPPPPTLFGEVRFDRPASNNAAPPTRTPPTRTQVRTWPWQGSLGGLFRFTPLTVPTEAHPPILSAVTATIPILHDRRAVGIAFPRLSPAVWGPQAAPEVLNLLEMRDGAVCGNVQAERLRRQSPGCRRDTVGRHHSVSLRNDQVDSRVE